MAYLREMCKLGLMQNYLTKSTIYIKPNTFNKNRQKVHMVRL